MSKLTKYGIVQGTTEKNGRNYTWYRYDFVFEDVSGKERTISCFPRNGELLKDLLGFTEKEIYVDPEIRHKS